ncbi:hypothetical protein INQ40_04850 [Lysobacter sp. H21R4]|uniref:hypothetical protein n=1 Tax=Lysobacter sp. H21R4 TaxID=2781021 RepID=UPI001887673E|nr:hypothetical protein [Lysobacter sp. H21R4]QOY63565.1 hypothetical protein INQ40_04850 [Lysobacter sp. H21R4]
MTDTNAPAAEQAAPTTLTQADIQQQIADAIRADRASSDRRARAQEQMTAARMGHRPILDKHRHLGDAAFWSAPESNNPHAVALKIVHERAGTGYKALLEAMDGNARDALLSTPERVQANARQARSLRDNTVSAINSAINSAEAERDAVGARAHRITIPADAYSQQLAAEVRGHLRSLKPADRVAFAEQAIADTDTLLLQAIASAPAALSGLPAEVRERARREVITLLAPEDSAAAAAIDKGLELCTRTRDRLLEHLGELFDPAHMGNPK